jgi:hypothetical protein
VGQHAAPVAEDSGEDPRVAGLTAAVARLRSELAAHPADLPDRGAAEEELDSLDAQVAENDGPTVETLRASLLQVQACIGSVSALAEPMLSLRKAIELFGEPTGLRGGPSALRRADELG